MHVKVSGLGAGSRDKARRAGPQLGGARRGVPMDVVSHGVPDLTDRPSEVALAPAQRTAIQATRLRVDVGVENFSILLASFQHDSNSSSQHEPHVVPNSIRTSASLASKRRSPAAFPPPSTTHTFALASPGPSTTTHVHTPLLAKGRTYASCYLCHHVAL